MDVIWSAIVEAITMLFGGDADVWEIIFLSMRVSGVSIVIAMLVGIPLGYYIGSRRRLGSRFLLILTNTGMGLPPVVAGLTVYIFLSRSGPIAELVVRFLDTAYAANAPHSEPRMLFTTWAMMIAQVVISAPLVTGVTAAAIGSVPIELRLQARSLGASGWQEAVLTIKEARRGVMAAVVAGFGGIISEVGAVMLVGGNIEGSTRVLTTAIVLETRKGNFELAMAISIILLSLSFLANVAMLRLQGRTFDE